MDTVDVIMGFLAQYKYHVESTSVGSKNSWIATRKAPKRAKFSQITLLISIDGRMIDIIRTKYWINGSRQKYVCIIDLADPTSLMWLESLL